MIFWALRIENRARLYPFLSPKNSIFGRYLYVDNVDEIFIRIHIFANVRMIRMNVIFLHPHAMAMAMGPMAIPNS